MASQALFTAAAGMKAQQQNIDTIANNIANIGTGGYRRVRQDFTEAVYTAMQDPSRPANDQPNNLQRGHGVLASATRTDFTPGSLEQTARSLDLALSGSGFYAAENPGGPTVYSRDGVFQTSSQDNRHYLVTIGGNFVLDSNGQRISADQPFDRMSVDAAGTITVDSQIVATLGIFDFANPDGLLAAGGKNFLATDASGQAMAIRGDVRQGFVENANVDLAGEMTELISAQRAYAFLSRAISTADEMRAIENSIRR